jgi:hypothetical protein
MTFLVRSFFLPACALTTSFALRSMHTHISMQIHIEMCVGTLLDANSMVEMVRAHVLKGTFNFSLYQQF